MCSAISRLKGQWYKKTVADGLLELFCLNSNLGAPGSSETMKLMHRAQIRQLLVDW